jgi:hypothetical protein
VIVVPLTLKQANALVAQLHRHHMDQPMVPKVRWEKVLGLGALRGSDGSESCGRGRIGPRHTLEMGCGHTGSFEGGVNV